jgi:hypothetical protein
MNPAEYFENTAGIGILATCDAGRIKKIKEQHKNRFSTESMGKHLVYFEINETRPLVGDK